MGTSEATSLREYHLQSQRNVLPMSFAHRLLFFACGLHLSVALPPGIPSGLYGHLVGESDFELNLQPPQETAQDTKERLDALLSEENIKTSAALTTFSSDKQRMLARAKTAIRDVVEVSFFFIHTGLGFRAGSHVS